MHLFSLIGISESLKRDLIARGAIFEPTFSSPMDEVQEKHKFRRMSIAQK